MATRRRKAMPGARVNRPARSWSVSESGAATLLLGQRLERLIAELGNNRLAQLLSVSASQPSRWRTGAERISPEKQRSLIDLDYVMARLLQLFPSEQAEIWLSSHNAHLGARPIDVLKLRGANAILPAIDAEAQGAYA